MDMKKKIKAIPVIAIVLMVLTAGIGGAILVDYLSNTITADVTVESPIMQEISKGEGWTDTISIEAIKGGDTITFHTRTTNLADAPITGTVDNIVTNPWGLAPEDFASVCVTTNGDGPYDLIAMGLCTQGDANTVTFSYGPTPITWQAGQVDITEIEVTFKSNATGTYTFTSQVVPT